MSRLIYVPVVHSGVEMGSAEAAYQAAFIARYGERKWQERTAQFDAIWSGIARAIGALGLDLHRVMLYQDSLPVCGKEGELVRELAAQGSRNHRLLEHLIAGGARLVGTESPALLMEEYRLLQSGERTAEREEELLDRRDRFIAERIATTLGENETGVLFIGALHDVARHLPRCLRVEYLAVGSGDAAPRS